jgi:hypothetical protein
MMNGITEFPARTMAVQGEEMLQPDEVAAMVRLHELGWGAKRLSKEFGCARNTVRRYLRAGGAVPFAKPERKTAFDGLDDWLRERFFRHGGNADVIRQELASEHGIVIGLRSVELRVQRWRRELQAQKRATVRFETPPGHQLQIDFGESKVWIGDERVRVHLFWRRWATRAGCISSPRSESAKWTGSKEWRERSCGLAACRPKYSSTMPRRWSSIMTPRPVRCASIPDSTPLRDTGLLAASLRSIPGAHQGQG